jgi:hypothetical protein
MTLRPGDDGRVELIISFGDGDADSSENGVVPHTLALRFLRSLARVCGTLLGKVFLHSGQHGSDGIKRIEPPFDDLDMSGLP